LSDVPVLTRHDQGCQHPRAIGHSDAARRASDAYNLHVAARSFGTWIAIALHDGSTDGTPYHSRKAAVSHQHHNEQWYCYARIMPHAMTVCAAESFLRMHRMAYDAGFRMTDPEARGGGNAIIPRISNEEHSAQLSALASRVLPLQRIS